MHRCPATFGIRRRQIQSLEMWYSVRVQFVDQPVWAAPSLCFANRMETKTKKKHDYVSVE